MLPTTPHPVPVARRPGKVLAAVAAALALGVALSACGPGTTANPATGGPGASGDQVSAGSVPGGKGPAIKIMTIGPWTQPAFGTKNPEFPAGAQARVDAINAKGGLNGRPVQLIVCSDESNPNTARSCAQQAVAEHVAAVVGMQTFAGNVVLPILAQAGIPAVGVAPFLPTDLAANSFPDVGGVLADNVGVVDVLKALGSTHQAGIWPAGVMNPFYTQLQQQRADAVGAKFSGNTSIPVNSSDLSAVVTKATENGVDGLFGFAANEPALVTAVKQNAPGVKLVSESFNLGPQNLKSLGQNAEGLGVVLHTVPYTADVPGAKLYQADMAKYQAKQVLSNDGLHEWMAVWTFERVVGALPTIDANSVTDAYSKIRDLDMGGLTPPYSTTVRRSGELARLFQPSIIPGVVKGGRIELLDGPTSFIDPFPSAS